MFNHLPPSDHERHASQSTSSGLRRLNRGNCCTPKFSLPYSSRFIKNHPQMAQDFSRVAQSRCLLSQFKTRVLVLSRNLRFSVVQSSPMCPYTSSSTYISSLKTHNVKSHSQKLHLIHNQLQGQNGHFAVKSQKFWSTSHFEPTIII